jgi:hypothetical protein
METVLYKNKDYFNLILYTFDNITNFNKDFLNTTTFDIKFISYGDNQLKIIFNNILTNDQEFELLDILHNM